MVTALCILLYVVIGIIFATVVSDSDEKGSWVLLGAMWPLIILLSLALFAIELLLDIWEVVCRCVDRLVKKWRKR